MKLALRKLSAPGVGPLERTLARLINWGTGSAGYYHAELLFEADGMALTADPCAGVTIWPHAYDPARWHYHPLPDVCERPARWWAEQHVRMHEPYDVLGAVACSPVGRLLFPWVRHRRAHLYCSLACYRAMHASLCGFPAVPWHRRSGISPNDLARAIHAPNGATP